jgi:hypothetical protein
MSSQLNQLVEAVTHIALHHGNSKAARWGPAVLKALLVFPSTGGGTAADGTTTGAPDNSSDSLAAADGAASKLLDILSSLATSALSVLRHSAVADEGTPCALQSMCAVGEAAPAIFAGDTLA